MTAGRSRRRPRFAVLIGLRDMMIGLITAFRAQRLGWLLVMLPTLLAAALFMAFASSTGVLAPFVYPLF